MTLANDISAMAASSLFAAKTPDEFYAAIKAGADLNARDMWGETPLHYAAMEGYTDSVNVLLEAGADVNAREGFIGNTPLHNAASCGHEEISKTLIRAGADVNAKNKYGETPYDYLKNNPSLAYLIKEYAQTESALKN